MAPIRILLTPAFSLLITIATAQLRIQNFGIAEGMPQSEAQSMAEDSQGYLWIGTLEGGLSRFDGRTFETFTITDGLINNLVCDLHIDPENRIWVATTKGVSMFDGVAFHNLKTTDRAGDYVNKIFSNGKDIMYLTRDGEYGKVWYDSTMHNRALGSINNIKSFRKTPNNNTFILQQHQGKPYLLVFGDRDSLALHVDFKVIHAAFVYKGEQILSTNEGLYSYHSGRLRKFLDLKAPVYCFDDTHDQFIGISNSRIATFDLTGKLLYETDPVKYLILSSLKDRDGTLWLGTDQGLFKIYSYDFENPFTDKDREDAIFAICFHNNQLWVGTTYQGIKVYENNKLVKSYNLGSKNKNVVRSIKEDNNNKLWIGTLGGLAVLEDGKIVWKNEDLVKQAAAFDFDNENNVLVAGAPQGLFRIKNQHAENLPEFQSTGVWDVRYDHVNNYFVIGTDVGLRVFESDKGSAMDVKALRGYQIASFDWIDNTTLALGTFGDGLLIYSFQTRTLYKINASHGLVSNTIFFVFRDSEGIWVGTEKGIDLVQYDQSKNKVVSIEHFDEQDGLLGLETNLNSVIRKDSILFFGLVKGLFQHRKQKIIGGENAIHIRGINLFNRPYHDAILNYGFSIDSSLVYSFKHDQNHLTFLFNKVSKKKPTKYFYTYKLSDFDQIWSQPSLSNKVTYSNLSPGSYTFEIRATDKAGAFVFDKTTVHFNILPAYYQTLYFKILVGIVVCVFLSVAVFLIYRIRTNRAISIQTIKNNEQARLREEIARDFHDELGNQVARMINYVGLLRISQKMEKEIYQTLNTYSQTILNGTKDFVWALDPKNDDLASVLIHLKDFGERMFSEKNIQFSFHGNLPDAKLPMGYGRQINLIFKEAMTNTFKHANAKSVDLTFSSMSSKEFSITLTDDGTGMDNIEIRDSERGIENMRIRAKKISSTISIQSNGNGMEVKLSVLLPVRAK